MKQNHEIRFRCNKEQHEQIKRKAELIGMTIKNYILYLILHTQVEINVVE